MTDERDDLPVAHQHAITDAREVAPGVTELTLAEPIVAGTGDEVNLTWEVTLGDGDDSIRILSAEHVPADVIIEDLRAKVAEFEATFDIVWKAQMRAINRWQAAHPGMESVWPDTSNLIEWLLERAFPGQPLPTPNEHPAVWDLVTQDIRGSQYDESITTLVLADIEERDHVGEVRYGVRLQPHNGRDTLRDAYEEALDLLVYLRSARYENPQHPLYIDYAVVMNVVMHLRGLLRVRA